MSLPRERGGGQSTSGVGVLDRAVEVLDAVEAGARSFTDIAAATGLARATAHRLVKALETHGFLTRTDARGYRLGPRLLRLAARAARELSLSDLAHPALERLASTTGESAQLYLRTRDRRVCVDAVESTSELRTIVEPGASLPLTAGSAGKVILAHARPADRERLIARAEALTPATPIGERLAHQVAAIRRRGWAESAGERAPGVGSVSAPVLGADGRLVAVVSISGPVSRLGRAAARRYARHVVAAAREIEAGLGGAPR